MCAPCLRREPLITGYLRQSRVVKLASQFANLVDGSRLEPDRTAVASATRAPQPLLRRALVVGVVATVAIVCGALAGGRTFVSTLPGSWFFGPTTGAADTAAGQPPLLALIGVYGGIILLGRAWLDLLRVSRSHPGMPVRRVVGVIGAWALPLALAPPLFSRDLYSYAGQGEMVAHGISPYLYGTGILGFTPFSTLPGSFWANTPSPYGPGFLWLDGLATHLARHQVLADLVLLRLLALAGLAMALWAIPLLARAAGRDPAPAVVLALGSPLVLTTLVGGAHNDALMLGLLLAGLAVARRYATAPGIVLCALAASVKAPALLGVLFLAWNWPGSGARLTRRLGHVVAGCAIGLATLSAVSWTTGIGWDWVRTATSPTKVITGITPVDSVSRLLTDVAHLVGFGVGGSAVRTVVSVAALAGIVLLGGWLLVRSPQFGVERSLGLLLVALVVLGPILWPWYLTWGLSVLAPTAGRWTRRLVIALAIGGALLGATAVVHAASAFASYGVAGELLVLVALVAVAVAPLSRQAGGRRAALMTAVGP
jgi:alpha-1,6-mannosyltransferase